ncbi:MAG: mechanosensitive ion channel domain-containing protein [Thermoanaerobaculia bacterium]
MLDRSTKTHRVSTSVELKLLLALLLALVAVVGLGRGLQAQDEQAPDSTQQQPGEPSAPDTASVLADIVQNKEVSTESLRQIRIPPDLLRTVSSEQHADVMYMNRKISRLRAQIMGNLPDYRARDSSERIEKQVEIRRTEPVDSVYIEQGVLIRIAGKTMFAITTADLDLVAGETLEGRAEEAIADLEKAIGEAEALRRPGQLLRSLGFAAVITLVYSLWILFLVRLERLFERKLEQFTDRTLKKSIAGTIATKSDQSLKIVKFAGQLARIVGALLIFTSTYLWLTAVLKRFPFTRPWGEALGDYLLGIFAWIGNGILQAIPGLFIVVVIYFLTRATSRAVSAAFTAVQEERLHLPGLHAETARPTRKLVIVALWLLAVVVAFPYLPGSSTDAFKGLSVFLGLMISLGSTGVVNQAMSGLMLMYSRALRVGDWVLVGSVEGEVLQMGMLSTKVRTRAGEEVTVPNAVVIAKETVNYTRFAKAGVRVNTTVTIGYDTPWRQVHALLEGAAANTAGLRKEPPPFVLQTGLSDWYPEYRLVAVIEDPSIRPLVLSDLHQNIQDLFNQFGVQIMSPHYINNPPEPFVVPPERRSPPPAPAERTSESAPKPTSES